MKLDGLNFSLYAKWPGAIHEGKGEAVVFVDERAAADQRKTIERLLDGKVGGPWEVLGWTWPTVHGPYAAAYDFAFDGVQTRVKCGEYLDVQSAVIRNPVTGAESHPAVILPEGIIFKQGDLGTTSRFRLSSGISYDHSGKYMAVGPFDYRWTAGAAHAPKS